MERTPFWGEKGCWHSIPSPPDDFLPIPVLYNMHSTSENYTNINLIFNRYRYIYKLKIIFIKKNTHIELTDPLLAEEAANMSSRSPSRDSDLPVVLLSPKPLRGHINRLFQNRHGHVHVKCTKSTLEIYLENIASVNAYITSRIHVT